MTEKKSNCFNHLHQQRASGSNWVTCLAYQGKGHIMCPVWGCVNPKYMLTDYCRSGEGCFPVIWGKKLFKGIVYKKNKFHPFTANPYVDGGSSDSF